MKEHSLKKYFSLSIETGGMTAFLGSFLEKTHITESTFIYMTLDES